MYNLRYGLNYLRHRFVANNRHGIHSPFVYKLIDTVIYDYSPQKVYREIAAYAKAHHPDKRLINTLPLKVYQLIYRLAVYFNPRVIAFAGDDNGVLSLSIKKAVPDAILTDVNRLSGYNSPDWVMIDASRGDIIHAFNDCLQYIQSQTIMLFFNIHRKMEIEAAWKVVKTNKRVMLSIDLFYIGLVFFKENRKEQEHFAIKY